MCVIPGSDVTRDTCVALAMGRECDQVGLRVCRHDGRLNYREWPGRPPSEEELQYLVAAHGAFDTCGDAVVDLLLAGSVVRWCRFKSRMLLSRRTAAGW